MGSLETARLIFGDCLRGTDHGSYLPRGVQRIYVSPSIIYCAHPRYACPIQLPGGSWLQVILQCRVAPQLVDMVGPRCESLGLRDRVRIDPHIPNADIEWVLQ